MLFTKIVTLSIEYLHMFTLYRCPLWSSRNFSCVMSFRRSNSLSTATTFFWTADSLELASSSSQICNCFVRSLSFRGKNFIPWPILVYLIMSAKREEVNSSMPICASFKYCSSERSSSRASCLRMHAISSFLPIASAVRFMIDCTRCRLRAMSSSNIFNLSCLTLGIEGEEEDSNFALIASSFVIIASFVYEFIK